MIRLNKKLSPTFHMDESLLNALFGLPLARHPCRGYLSSVSKGSKKVATAQATATEKVNYNYVFRQSLNSYNTTDNSSSAAESSNNGRKHGNDDLKPPRYLFIRHSRYQLDAVAGSRYASGAALYEVAARRRYKSVVIIS